MESYGSLLNQKKKYGERGENNEDATPLSVAEQRKLVKEIRKLESQGLPADNLKKG